jgi:hypothetical protein
MLILFVLFAIILFFGMIGDKDKTNRCNFTYAFIVCVVAIILLSI